jgi:precorrin-3B synthase
MLTGSQLALLTSLATEHGDGHLELTSRANVQLRALTNADPAVLEARLAAAGLLPSATHETVRNIAAPPLADAEIRGLVRALDEALCADLALAALPGRFLFAIGDVALDADVAAIPAAPISASTDPRSATLPLFRINSAFDVLVGGVDVGLRVSADNVVATLLAAARAFLDQRSEERPEWRIREISDGAARIAASLHVPRTPRPAAAEAEEVTSRHPTAEADERHGAAPVQPVDADLVGILAQADGRFAVGALVPLGRLSPVHGGVLAEAERLVVTPRRGVVVPDLSEDEARRWARELAGAGLEVEAASRWTGVTSCAGKPGCAKALADVRADADATTRHIEGLPVHWIGCARGCGSPSGAHVRVEATADGYLVDGTPVERDGLAKSVAAARRG